MRYVVKLFKRKQGKKGRKRVTVMLSCKKKNSFYLKKIVQKKKRIWYYYEYASEHNSFYLTHNYLIYRKEI